MRRPRRSFLAHIDCKPSGEPVELSNRFGDRVVARLAGAASLLTPLLAGQVRAFPSGS
jgi:hypothetical protein